MSQSRTLAPRDAENDLASPVTGVEALVCPADLGESQDLLGERAYLPALDQARQRLELCPLAVEKVAVQGLVFLVEGRERSVSL